MGVIFSQKVETQLQTMIVELDSNTIDMDSLIEDEEGLKHHPDTKKLYSGKVIKFYEGNKKRREGTYKDGKEIGLWTVWSKKGQKIQELLYKEGGQVIETQWYKNGQKRLLKNGLELLTAFPQFRNVFILR